MKCWIAVSPFLKAPGASRNFAMRVFTIFGVLIGLVVAQETGNHPEWQRWCGKAYQPQ